MSEDYEVSDAVESGVGTDKAAAVIALGALAFLILIRWQFSPVIPSMGS